MTFATSTNGAGSESGRFSYRLETRPTPFPYQQTEDENMSEEEHYGYLAQAILALRSTVSGKPKAGQRSTVFDDLQTEPRDSMNALQHMTRRAEEAEAEVRRLSREHNGLINAFAAMGDGRYNHLVDAARVFGTGRDPFAVHAAAKAILEAGATRRGGPDRAPLDPVAQGIIDSGCRARGELH